MCAFFHGDPAPVREAYVAAFTGSLAGYTGTEGTTLTTMTASWTEPSLPCADTDDYDLVMQFGVRSPGGRVDKRISTDVECFEGFELCEDPLPFGIVIVHRFET